MTDKSIVPGVESSPKEDDKKDWNNKRLGYKKHRWKNFLESKCLGCGNLFEHNKKTAKYCSIKCSNSYHAASYRVLKKRRSSIENTLRVVMQGARSRAKRKGMACNISDLEILALLKDQKGKCAMTGIEMLPSMEAGFRLKSPFTVSVDRIDSNKGYIKDNVHLVCVIFNECKNSHTIDDVKRMCVEFIKYNNIKIE